MAELLDLTATGRLRPLVGGEGLGRGEVEGGGSAPVRGGHAVEHGGEHGREVAEGFSAGGPCGDYHSFVGHCEV